jgi:hypothetical protein
MSEGAGDMDTTKVECRNCLGTGFVSDLVVSGITHRKKTVKRKCVLCAQRAELLARIAEPEHQEISEAPAWLLGLDDSDDDPLA